MKNSTLNRMLVAMTIAFAFALSGCVTPETTAPRKGTSEVVLEPIAFDPETLLQNKSWSLSCLASETSDMDAICAKAVADQPTNYTRILVGTQNGEKLFGFESWRAQADFDGCGSIDLTNDEVNSLANDGIVFDAGGIVTGAAYVNDQVACETKDGQAPGMENISYRYNITGLKADGVTYQYESGRSYQFAADCSIAEVSTVSLLTYDGVDLVEVVIRNDQAFEMTPGACAGAPLVVGTYALKLTHK